jgi:hypothetical protein
MTKIYHGTTMENYESILKDGFQHDTDCLTWDNASDSDYIYFWNPKDVKKAYLNDDSTMQEAIEESKRQAAESAKITAAVFKSRYERVVILEMEVNSKYISPDDSCENMSGAVKVNCDNLKPSMIKNVYYSDFVPSASLFYLVGLIDNQNIDLYNHLSSIEINLLNQLKGIDLPEEFYFSEVYDD